MAGPVFIGGGGSELDERLLWLEMLTPRALRVLYWSFALADDLHLQAETWLQNAVERISPEAVIATWRTLHDRHPAELAEFDLLFVGGGNTFRLLQQVQENKFLQPVRDFVQSGGAYYGGSAGAVLACETAEIAIGHNPNEAELTDFKALGLLTGVALLPHYDSSQLSSAVSFSRQHGCEVIGVPERSGLVVRDGQIQVVGTAAAWVIRETNVVARQPGESWPISP